MTPILYQITCDVPCAHANPVDDLLSRHAEASSCFELDDDGTAFRITALRTTPWSIEKISTELDLLFMAMHWDSPPALTTETLMPRDWVSENQKTFEPIACGPLVIEASHGPFDPRSYRHRLIIDAATAFGTGRHGSTLGCLQALMRLKQKGYNPQSIADIGTGTGILAFAATKIWPHAQIIGTDIDPHATEQANHNRRLNHLSPHKITFGLCPESHIFLPPQDLVLANILESPLFRLARDLSAMVTVGGYLILSGFYTHQQTRLKNVFGSYGMQYRFGMVNQRWQALALQKVNHG